MPRPSAGDVHVNRILSNISVAFVQDAKNFVAAQVFPNVPVQNKSDLYFIYSQADFNRDEMRTRAAGTESAGGSYGLTQGTYSAVVKAYHKDIDDQIRSNADAPLNMDIDATKYVTNIALINRERVWANKYFTTGVWGNTDQTGVAGTPSTNQFQQWNVSTSTPPQDIRAQKVKILQATGYDANTLILGYPVYSALLDNAEVIDRIKYQGTPGNPATVNENTLAQLFDVERVLVMKSVYNSANEGQTATMNFIGGKAALLLYAAPNAGLYQPSAGYTFSWNGYLGAGPAGNRIKQFRMEELASDRVEIEMAYDMQIVSSVMGVFFASAVA